MLVSFITYRYKFTTPNLATIRYSHNRCAINKHLSDMTDSLSLKPIHHNMSLSVLQCIFQNCNKSTGPARSSSIRTRASVAEVNGWRFTFPSGDSQNLLDSLGNVSPPFRQRPGRHRIPILLLFNSNPAQRHRHIRTELPVLLQTGRHRGRELPDILKYFSSSLHRKRGQNFKIYNC